MAKKPAKPPAELPDVEPRDEVYFRHASGPMSGKVLSRGSHGCWIDAAGVRHKMRWEDFLGHKIRVQSDAKVVSKGEDGLLVESSSGHRRFVRDPMGVIDPPPEPMRKSFLPVVLFFGAAMDLLKAAGGGKPIKNRPGLVLQDVTDSRGNRTKRWKKASQDPPGQHNLGHRHHVKFHAPHGPAEGQVNGKPGKHGAHVDDAVGRQHKVPYEKITHHAPPDGEAEKPPEPQGEEFKAAAFAQQHDAADVTPEKILSQFDEKVRAAVADADKKVQEIVQTVEKYRQGEDYQTERQAVHRAIHAEFLTPEKIKAATPPAGQKPTFTILGGRGGSGKSKLEHRAFDPDKAIVIDPDVVKSKLPEYRGWNAHEVHEESSDIADAIINMARLQGLNVVLDGTLKTPAKALAKVEAFKAAGYQIEAHYMHLPRQMAAARAISRFMTKKNDGSGRYVPVAKVLENTTNEDSFDQVRKHADAWSFYDNQVGKDDPPTLIAKGGKKAADVG